MLPNPLSSLTPEELEQELEALAEKGYVQKVRYPGDPTTYYRPTREGIQALTEAQSEDETE